MRSRMRTASVTGALVALSMLCRAGVYGEETAGPAPALTRGEFIAYAFTNGSKADAADGLWVKGFDALYTYRGEFPTDFTTEHKPGKGLEAPKHSFIRYTLVDSKPAMTSPDDFGEGGGKDLVFLQLYNSEAREYLAGLPSKRASFNRSMLSALTGPRYQERVYSHCYDVGFDGFNDLYDTIVDEYNILNLKRYIIFAQAGNMKWVGKKNKAVYQAVCDVLAKELYKAIRRDGVVEDTEQKGEPSGG